MKTKIISSIVLLVIIFSGFAYYHARQLPNQMTSAITETFVVKRGASFSTAAKALEEQGVIKNAFLFKLLAKKRQQDHLLKSGEYNLQKSVSLGDLLTKLTDGDVIIHSVTLIDGWTFQNFRTHLAKQELLVINTDEMTNEQIMDAIGAPKTNPEGQFAPDTYQFQKGDSDLDILKRSFKRQQELVDLAWQNRQPSPHIKTKEEALTLASIIEKETGQGGERAEISGVFYNRLRIGMKLQTDPTVIYGMGKLYKGNIKRVHLRTDTPYNTYTRYGLPPTPIAMPGKASITAALNPKKTKSLYFVGKGDGTHYFSKNLAEHNRAVTKYQLGR